MLFVSVVNVIIVRLVSINVFFVIYLNVVFSLVVYCDWW